MNYKNLALMMLLLPITSLGSSNEARIKELEEAQFNMEKEISRVSKWICEETESYSDYKYIAKQYWNASDQDENLFGQLEDELCLAFDALEDIDLLVEQKVSNKKNIQGLKNSFLQLILQSLFIDKIFVQYKELVKQLTAINHELKTLKK